MSSGDEPPSRRRGFETRDLEPRTANSTQRFEHLFQNLEDAVVEFEHVEKTPVVRAVNQAFVDVFGYERETILGGSLNEFIVPEPYTEEAQVFDTRTYDGEHTKAVVRRETADGIRRFLYRGVPYERPDGSTYGFAIYSDITDETRREHRLQVLHRILRHNLRNKLNVIKELADVLEHDHNDPEIVEPARLIKDQTNELTHLSSEASHVERILDRAEAHQGRIDVVTLCERVVSEYRPVYPEATIELDVPDSLTLTATDHLELALQQLVENALEHNDTSAPQLRVMTRRTASSNREWIEIAVADDGPLIQQGERQVIEPDAASDQLSHGSGLGLRLVQWITDVAGGTVSIEESDLGGNRVVLRFKQ